MGIKGGGWEEEKEGDGRWEEEEGSGGREEEEARSRVLIKETRAAGQ